MNRKTKLLTVSFALLMLLRLGPVSAAIPIPAESQVTLSLNGNWRFKLEQENGKSKRPASYGEKAPLELPATFEPFYRTNYFEKASWHDLKVPGNWEMAGYHRNAFAGLSIELSGADA